MSPRLLHLARKGELQSRRSSGRNDPEHAIYPRDFYRPVDRRVIMWLTWPILRDDDELPPLTDDF